MRKRQKRLLALSARAVRVAKALVPVPLPPLSAGSGPMWYGEDQIMAATGLCRSTVRRALQELAPYTMSRTLQRGGRGRPPLIYALTTPARQTFSALPEAPRG